MSKSIISTGTTTNDGNGDTLIAGAIKINSNFTEVYSAIGDGSNINIGLGKTFLSTNSSGYIGIQTTNATSPFQVYVGPAVIGSATSTGTTNQKLQVDGGAYISGNLGLGITNPVGELQVFSGPAIIGSATSTGTASQRLQVTGGAYISGSIGIGTTNPIVSHHVVGNQYITGVSTIGLANTSTPPGNSQMSFELTSDTNLRIKVKGSDGVLRMVDLTLS